MNEKPIKWKTSLNDIFEAETVEITIDTFGKMWVNVDGACALRIGRADVICVDDCVVYKRKKETVK